MISLTCSSFLISILLILSSSPNVLCCHEVERDSLLSFHRYISAAAPLNWTYSADCCEWEGVTCSSSDGRVSHLSLPSRGLRGTIFPTFVLNLTSLSHLNLSRNQFSGPVPDSLFRRLQTLDLSYNRLSGAIFQSNQTLPISITTLDLSSNLINGSVDPLFLRLASNLIQFNVSNNSFTGPIPSSICSGSPLLESLDFSVNKFTGGVAPGISRCSRLKVFRAGFNALSGLIPSDMYYLKTLEEISLTNNQFSGPMNNDISMLSNLRILELHVNELSGGIPPDIGLLTNLEQLQLHTNRLNGSVPPSLTDCSNLKTLLLRNNLLGGEISTLDFSKLQRLQAIDFGNNSFAGEIPGSLCLCRSVTAVRLAYNKLTGEIPPCMASLKSLAHLSISDNYLSNVAGALEILKHCDNLEVLFLSRCFDNEPMPDLLLLNGFQKLQILTLGGCQLKGRIPLWIAKLRKVKLLNLSYNQIYGPIPTWLGDMPSLFVLNLTQNFLSGGLPPELGRLPALISDNSSSDLSYLALPFLFDSFQYNRLFNLPRGLKVGNNRLTGSIPKEIGRLKLLHILELSNNFFNGSIPSELSGLVNLEKLDMSGNHLSGEIPRSLERLHFLSAFSVANNDLEGQIPSGGQFDTFSPSSFEGNPRLCGAVLHRNCPVKSSVGTSLEEEEEESSSDIPFGIGYFVGFFAVSISLVFHSPWSSGGVVTRSISFPLASSL
ncbi:tyrosine-sulfated glycopeptide receptor 1 [Dorcoceras hygrometricum]|uniref:Tyrosine-sulfated glycopeptide receptor 1 n=1 Tax=Dorcoceras hygrometricum TaxID=472368 RepID=A0A2Z7AWH3_9LAMI|nr:tyrosine-sulfated glycopeptide receptor 1 [Dorcoceras hygrometricum]